MIFGLFAAALFIESRVASAWCFSAQLQNILREATFVSVGRCSRDKYFLSHLPEFAKAAVWVAVKALAVTEAPHGQGSMLN